MNKTKIVCTLGPASENRETLKNMILRGMNVVRFNMSHADREKCKETIKIIRELEKETKRTIGILFDTKGPEIRTGNFVDGEVYLKKDSKIRIMMNEILGNDRYFSIDYPGLIDDVEDGDIILLNDGMIKLTVTGKELDSINCVVSEPGLISNHKGVNVPDVKLHLPFLNEREISDITFASEMQGDFLAASFVSSADDVLDISDLLIGLNNDHMKIISKIENKHGLKEIDEIINASDGIMIARGDLGVEIPLEEVPIAQKKIISKCHSLGKITIVATEMLSSMERNARPTRAEVSDVANAVLDGTDAVMLSGETTIGDYPVQVVDTMRKIVESTEDNSNYNEYLNQALRAENQNITEGIAFSIVNNANLLNAKLIIAATMSGYTARKVSRLRPSCPILATSPNEKTVRSLVLNWGVYPILSREVTGLDDMIKNGITLAKENFILKRRDVVIVSAGFPFNTEKKTNFLKIEEIE